MKTALTAAFIALAAPAVACDAVTIHVASYHTDRSLIADVQEINPGLGCRFDDVAFGASVEFGAYLNSYADVSPYVIATGNPRGLSWFAGLAGGYQDDMGVDDHGVTPVLGLQYGTDLFTLKASGSKSALSDDLGAVFALSFEY